MEKPHQGTSFQEDLVEPRPDLEETNGNTPGQTILDKRTPRVCSCGKPCKNERGLKIHMGHMGCPPILNLVQRSGEPYKPEEETDQETHYRARDLLAQGEGEEATHNRPVEITDKKTLQKLQ